MTMHHLLFPLLLVLSFGVNAQPDTLYVPSGDTLFTFAVVYDPVEPAEQYKLIGRYAHDPDRVAVSIDHKRGKPSGVYRAWYPDGRPLIFAVYGWGSLHGDWTEYDEFGRITIKGQYRNGLREGTWAFRKLGIVGKYREGLKHGKWKYYDQGRLVRVEKFRNGELMPGSTYRIQ
jgi:antitoxin component YwqK of YwqJK toxin-antitoxin module